MRTHSWSDILRTVVFTTTLVALVGCTGPAAQQANLRRAQTELASRGDPDSLATAAYLERLALGRWRDASALAARAVESSPDRADLAFMQLQVCYQNAACNPEPLEAHLRALDPTNGITWIYALSRANRAHDEDGQRVAIAGLAQAQRVDEFWTELVSHMTATLAGRRGFDQTTAFVTVVGVGAAMVSPALQPLSQYCSKDAVRQDAVLAQCRRIFATLEQADTLLLASYGNRMAAQVWPQGSVERVGIDARRRNLDYWLATGNLRDRRLDSAHGTRVLVGLYPRFATEQAVLRAWYADLGLSPEPPTDWNPKAPTG